MISGSMGIYIKSRKKKNLRYGSNKLFQSGDERTDTLKFCLMKKMNLVKSRKTPKIYRKKFWCRKLNFKDSQHRVI